MSALLIDWGKAGISMTPSTGFEAMAATCAALAGAMQAKQCKLDMTLLHTVFADVSQVQISHCSCYVVMQCSHKEET